MLRSTLHGVLAGAVALAAVAFAVPASDDPLDQADALHQAFVGFTDDVTDADLALLQGLGASDLLPIESVDTVAVTAPVSVLRQLEQRDDVRGVRSERHIQLNLFESVGYIGADQVDQPAPYDDGGTQRLRPGVDGSGVTVAVVDSGIWEAHPDFGDRVLGHYGFEFSGFINGSSDTDEDNLLTVEQRDAFAQAQGAYDLADEVGHGTHVAGTIGGNGTMWTASETYPENHGVAPGVNLVGLKMAAAFSGVAADAGFERNATAAFDWLLRHHDDPEFGPNGIQVANNSWGLFPEDVLFGTPAYDPLQELAQKLEDAGVTLVFAAGNSGGDDQTPTIDESPTGTDAVITVAATCKPQTSTTTQGCGENQFGQRIEGITDFSSRGVPADHPDADKYTVDVAAPGHQIVATASHISALNPVGQALEGDTFGEGDADSAANRLWYTSLSGTSMAAPHVTGVVALLKQVDPTLTTEEIRDILADTAVSFPGFSFQAQGHGLVDVPAALQEAHRRATTQEGDAHLPEQANPRAVERTRRHAEA